jgi:prefoldin subunit 4
LGPWLTLTPLSWDSYKLGEFFLHLTAENARKRIEQRNEELGEQMQKAEKQLAAYAHEMAELKVQLYGKFGKSINLERD